MSYLLHLSVFLLTSVNDKKRLGWMVCDQVSKITQFTNVDYKQAINTALVLMWDLFRNKWKSQFSKMAKNSNMCRKSLTLLLNFRRQWVIPSQKKIPFALTLSHTFKKLGWGLRTRGRECVWWILLWVGGNESEKEGEIKVKAEKHRCLTFSQIRQQSLSINNCKLQFRCIFWGVKQRDLFQYCSLSFCEHQ